MQFLFISVDGLTYHHSYFESSKEDEEESAELNNFLRPPDTRSSSLEGLRWIVEPPNEAAFSNSTGLRLECIARGKNVQVQWYQRDTKIRTDPTGLRFVSDNGTLTFFPFR
ncbi:unnamed protein product [Lepeophtheirus salmonis]|uniref:(salmon louse) hypothetical protein n=1 Tax=Lepeophtheirus salmonis TaxID=72036 RepID=A0A7R8CUY7_LEPSM|nr:unnamed protein product [Lepeophtheirus salmonis]CAF2940604.1 unnamed protein product [Lepeophtheirus salmonis]